MKKKINYKRQLELLRLNVKGWSGIKGISNTFNEFDRGHRNATLQCANDFLKVIEMALRGKLK
jgi:hypothetical protein